MHRSRDHTILGRNAWLAVTGALVLATTPTMAHADAGPPVDESYVQVTVSYSLRDIERRAEAVLRREIGTGGRYQKLDPKRLTEERGEEGEEGAERAEVRYRIERAPLRWTLRRDTLLAQATVSYWADARGPGFSPVTCNQDGKPMTGEIGCRTRLGWRDDWGLEARSVALPTVYKQRCKPKPPGINFTEYVHHDVSRIADSLTTSVEAAVAAATGFHDQVQAAWSALEQPVDLGTWGQLEWNPSRILVDPLAGAGDSVVARVAIAVRPRVSMGPPAASSDHQAAENSTLPEPRVRLARDRLGIAFDCVVPFAEVASRVLESSGEASPAAGREHPPVRDVEVRREGDRVALVLDLGTDAGRLTLLGAPRFDAERYELGIADLRWAPPSSRSGHKLSGRQLDQLRRRIADGVRFPVTAQVTGQVSQLGRALNRDLESATFRGGVNRREVAAPFVSQDALGVRMIAVGRATLQLH